MADFTKYRLPDDDNGKWILDKIREIGLDVFTEQEEKVKYALDSLKPGKYYALEDLSDEDKRDLFIKLSCLYIRCHPEVTFSNDYSKIEKIKIL